MYMRDLFWPTVIDLPICVDCIDCINRIDHIDRLSASIRIARVYRGVTDGGRIRRSEATCKNDVGCEWSGVKALERDREYSKTAFA